MHKFHLQMTIFGRRVGVILTHKGRCRKEALDSLKVQLQKQGAADIKEIL